MDQDQDFSALRNLLALKKHDMPVDTQVDQFLIEFHRRQRAQLLVPESIWARSMAWLKERVDNLELVPSLSYASAFAAIAITAVVGLSQEVQVTQVGGQSKLSFRMASQDTTFAMIPASFVPSANAMTRQSDNVNFIPARSDSATTRYVLANNSHGTNDSTVAF